MPDQWIKIEITPKQPKQCGCGGLGHNLPKRDFKVYAGSFTFHTKKPEGIMLVTTVEAKFMVENFKEIGQLIQDEVLSRFTSDFVLDTVELKKL